MKLTFVLGCGGADVLVRRSSLSSPQLLRENTPVFSGFLGNVVSTSVQGLQDGVRGPVIRVLVVHFAPKL